MRIHCTFLNILSTQGSVLYQLRFFQSDNNNKQTKQQQQQKKKKQLLSAINFHQNPVTLSPTFTED